LVLILIPLNAEGNYILNLALSLISNPIVNTNQYENSFLFDDVFSVTVTVIVYLTTETLNYLASITTPFVSTMTTYMGVLP
jgi:hypothetical protein